MINNLIQRSLTGALIALLTVFSVIWNEYSFVLFYATILVLCIIEYHIIIRKVHGHPILAWEIVLSLVLFTGSWLIFRKTLPIEVLILMIPLIFLSLITELYRRKKRVVQNTATTFLPVIHIALPFSLFTGLAYMNHTYDYRPVLAVILFTWTFDTFAYIFGVLVGKNKIAPKISPKKSWEGFAGGLIAGIGLAFILAEFWTMFTPTKWVLISIIISIGATFGDLVESMIKRAAGIKDSGNLLPGHGGVFDRFDGFVFAIPFVFSYLYIIN